MVQRTFCAGFLLFLLTGSVPPAASQQTAREVEQIERDWLALRTAFDEVGVARNLGAAVTSRGTPVDSMLARIGVMVARLKSRLDGLDVGKLNDPDRKAIDLLRGQVGVLGAELAARPAPSDDPADCGGPFPDRMRAASNPDLTSWTFACYGAAARRIVVDGDTLDRLSILGLMGRTDDSARRRRLFMALAPVWRSVNGDDQALSPYRRMVALRKSEWGTAQTPMAERAQALGIPADTMERWLVSILEGWRATLPDTLFEPWDFYHYNGEASRLLSPRIPLDSLRPLADRYYRDLGADPSRLRVRYDLTPRPGKYPVSFSDFGGRDPVIPWIFTSYRIGGLDNLAELLHEVGHAVHIAALRTRGAYLDWPDSDTFTEAIADLAALELYEPEWQQHYLGMVAPLPASIRSKYAGIVLDVAWALFEIRVHRTTDMSPNQIWTEITREYLRIRPHPEWSWWAMRGQLVGNPGYMLNYALGAIVIADIRNQVTARLGRFSTGNRDWYGWIGPLLYRFGRELPAKDVVDQFLGRRVTVEPLLRDLRRGTATESRPGGGMPGWSKGRS